MADALRLSKGITYKNAVAGLPLGGGKCVIIADPANSHKPELLRAFARHVQSLAGRYWTAIDVGVGPDDADILAEECDYVFARASQYEAGFNPSEFTALGGFMGIQAKAICGLANNQLAEDRHGAALRDAGIAYVPDYVVNAGGMIGASQVIYSEPSRAAAIKRIESLKPTIQSILQTAFRENRPTSDVANDMALQRIDSA